MGKRKKILQNNEKKPGLGVLEKSRETVAKSLLDIMLVEKDKLNGKGYDFSIVPNIYTLLYEFNRNIYFQNCKDSIDASIELKKYRNTKTEQLFKNCEISEFVSITTGSIISNRLKGIDDEVKLRAKKTLLGYYLLKMVNTVTPDLCVKTIFKCLENSFDNYIYKEMTENDIKLESLIIEPLKKENAVLTTKVFVEKNKINYLSDLIPYFNSYIEGYIDYRETNNDINMLVAADKVSEENVEVFKIIHNLGYAELKEEDINKIAKQNMSEEVFKQYEKSSLDIDIYYYQLVIPMSNYIAAKEIEVLLQEERLNKDAELNKLNEDNIKLMSENKGMKRAVLKAEQSVEELSEKLQRKDEEILKLKKSKCDDMEYNKLLEELEKYKLENQTLSQEVSKWKGKTESSQLRIQGLEDKVKKYNSLVSDFEELQQEKSELQDALEKVEDIIKSEETGVTYEEMLDKVQDLKILFIGGTPNVGNRLKETFPNLDFIDIADRNFNFIIPSSTDCVLLYTRVITHAHTERVYSLISEETPVIYINALNKRLVVQELYTQIINGHK